MRLRLDGLLVDDPRDNPTIFKQEFVGPAETNDFIYEFLHLNGGTSSGKWTWGMVGRVNGALLWPDALQYFHQQYQWSANRGQLGATVQAEVTAMLNLMKGRWVWSKERAYAR